MKKFKLKPVHKMIIGAIALVGITAAITSAIVKEVYPVDDTTPVIEMNDTTYSIKDLYNQITNTSASQDVLRQFIITKALFNQYEDKVSDSDVDKQFAIEKEQYSDNFQNVLDQNNLTEDDYKENIKKQLVINYGLRDNIDVTDDEIQAAWDSYYPESTVKIAVFENKDDADQFAKYAETGNFDTLLETAGALSTKANTMTFSSPNSPLPENVTPILWTLANDEVSEPIKGTDSATQATYYYVIKMIEKGEKDETMDNQKEQMIELAKTDKLLDNENMQAAIRSALSKVNIKINDPDLEKLVSEYIK